MTRNIFLLYLVLGLNLLKAQSSQEIDYQKNYEKRILLSRINDVYIPMNTLDAMKELTRLTEEDARKKLITISEDSIASKLHFSLGRWILINWGLEEGSRISHYYKMKGVSYYDDQVDLLLRCFYRQIAGQELREDDLVKHYIAKRNEEQRLRRSKGKVIDQIKTSKKHNE